MYQFVKYDFWLLPQLDLNIIKSCEVLEERGKISCVTCQNILQFKEKKTFFCLFKSNMV